MASVSSRPPDRRGRCPVVFSPLNFPPVFASRLPRCSVRARGGSSPCSPCSPPTAAVRGSARLRCRAAPALALPCAPVPPVGVATGSASYRLRRAGALPRLLGGSGEFPSIHNVSLLRELSAGLRSPASSNLGLTSPLREPGGFALAQLPPPPLFLDLAPEATLSSCMVHFLSTQAFMNAPPSWVG